MSFSPGHSGVLGEIEVLKKVKGSWEKLQQQQTVEMRQILFLLSDLVPSGDDGPFSSLLCGDERYTNDVLSLKVTGLCLPHNYSFLVLENLNAFIYSHSFKPEPDEGEFSHRECSRDLVVFLYFRLFPLTDCEGS